MPAETPDIPATAANCARHKSPCTAGFHPPDAYFRLDAPGGRQTASHLRSVAITTATPTTTTRPPSTITSVIGSLRNNAPKATATTGFTYAYVETREIGALLNSHT